MEWIRQTSSLRSDESEGSTRTWVGGLRLLPKSILAALGLSLLAFSGVRAQTVTLNPDYNSGPTNQNIIGNVLTNDTVSATTNGSSIYIQFGTNNGGSSQTVTWNAPSLAGAAAAFADRSQWLSVPQRMGLGLLCQCKIV